MIGFLVRVLVPIIVIFIVIRRAFHYYKRLSDDPKFRQTKPIDNNVIDICPNCGNVRTPNHHC